jgi:hypothetical protein
MLFCGQNACTALIGLGSAVCIRYIGGEEVASRAIRGADHEAAQAAADSLFGYAK